FKKGNLAKNTVVGTVMSNMGLEMHLKSKGINLIRTAVGDRYVVEAMREGEYNLGGESSGHLIFLHHSTTGDGMLAALRVLSVMCQREQSMEDLRNIYTPFPQINKSVMVRVKKEFHTIPELNNVITAFEKELSGKGRLLVRYSGTESKVRVMVEGENESLISKIADDVTGAVQKHLGAQ
ncbi:phosphoglucosamine mutase, partial [bacterium]|nr:phosphoglucosamine mutase [bacterium]